MCEIERERGGGVLILSHFGLDSWENLSKLANQFVPGTNN